MNEIDHRTRVAAMRRERMRGRLIEAAIATFGREGGVIDDVIRKAGVSRGTFYNYFGNADDLLRAVAFEAAIELMEAVAPQVEAGDDPAARVATGVRLWIGLVGQSPALATFFRRAGLYILETDRVRSDVGRDIVIGMRSGRFSVKELELGFVLVAGTVLAAINSLAFGQVPKNYGDKLAQRILMSLGVEEEDARQVSRRKLDALSLPAESLIVRALSK